LAHGLTPVLCVGETAEERRQGFTFTTVEGQLRAGLAGVTATQLGKVVLAYEPVWAIGTGVNATPAQAGEVHGYLRGLLSELASKEVAQSIRILYGGSVKAENVDELVAESGVDGALVGGARLRRRRPPRRPRRRRRPPRQQRPRLRQSRANVKRRAPFARLALILALGPAGCGVEADLVADHAAPSEKPAHGDTFIEALTG